MILFGQIAGQQAERAAGRTVSPRLRDGSAVNERVFTVNERRQRIVVVDRVTGSAFGECAVDTHLPAQAVNPYVGSVSIGHRHG